MNVNLKCLNCDKKFALSQEITHCDSCHGLVYVDQSENKLTSSMTEVFDERLKSFKKIDQSAVWRFREALIPIKEENIISQPEGRTNLYERTSISHSLSLSNLFFKHEGENPSGSFKDRGMTVATSMAKELGRKKLACASTGNTSASLALYASTAELTSYMFVPKGKISKAKMCQAMAYGIKCIEAEGDFDTAMEWVQKARKDHGLYLVNSLNPYRIEGQKTIIWDILQQLQWQTPDWIICPGGNLGNTSSFGKAIEEAYHWGWIKKKPKIATIQAKGASPFYDSFQNNFADLIPQKANTIATAIQIGNPVNFPKAVQAIKNTEGLVEVVSDEEIVAAKMQLDRSGIGCEPASACTLAGVKKLKEKNILNKEDVIVCILTGHLLKDSDRNAILYANSEDIKTITKYEDFIP